MSVKEKDMEMIEILSSWGDLPKIELEECESLIRQMCAAGKLIVT